MTNSYDRPPVYLVSGNHNTTHGIGEILFAIYHSLSGQFRVQRATGVKRDSVNIVIDEFSKPYFVHELTALKERYPDTRLIIVATEFITPITLLGLEIGRTFNFFGNFNDWKYFCGSKALELVGKLPPYMHRRYKGFVECLDIADLLVCVHPAIQKGLSGLGNRSRSPLAPPVVVYPEIDLRIANQEARLADLPFGFTLTGTLTRFRAKTVRRLIKAFARAGYEKPLYSHIPFGQIPPAVFDERGAKFNYDVTVPYLFNLNPQQQRNWPYSSPMRIMRAAMLGQIPVVTKKFGDHELEQIALLWDGKVSTAVELLRLAHSGRDELIRRYAESTVAYNETARQKNSAVFKAIERVLR